MERERAHSLAEAFGITSVAATLEEAVRRAAKDAVFDIATQPTEFLGILQHLPDGAGVLMQKPLMDYPKGVPGEFEYCQLEPGKEREWTSLPLEGSWFPDAFIGTMADLMCFLEGKLSTLPTAVDDAYRTMMLVEAAYESSQKGQTRISYD